MSTKALIHKTAEKSRIFSQIDLEKRCKKRLTGISTAATIVA
jgi:hypothetical protein